LLQKPSAFRRRSVHGNLLLDAADDAPVLDDAVATRLVDAFGKGSGRDLLQLEAGEVGQALPPALVWWRDFATRYVGALCLQGAGAARTTACFLGHLKFGSRAPAPTRPQCANSSRPYCTASARAWMSSRSFCSDCVRWTTATCWPISTRACPCRRRRPMPGKFSRTMTSPRCSASTWPGRSILSSRTALCHKNRNRRQERSRPVPAGNLPGRRRAGHLRKPVPAKRPCRRSPADTRPATLSNLRCQRPGSLPVAAGGGRCGILLTSTTPERCPCRVAVRSTPTSTRPGTSHGSTLPIR
jgi:hypothetical protein